MAVLFDRQNDKRGAISKGLHEDSSDERRKTEASSCLCFEIRKFLRSRRKSANLALVPTKIVDFSIGNVYQTKTHFRMISSFYYVGFIAVLFHSVHFCFIKKYYFNLGVVLFANMYFLTYFKHEVVVNCNHPCR